MDCLVGHRSKVLVMYPIFSKCEHIATQAYVFPDPLLPQNANRAGNLGSVFDVSITNLEGLLLRSNDTVLRDVTLLILMFENTQ